MNATHAVEDVPGKRFALDFLERNATGLARLSDSLFYFGELDVSWKVPIRRVWFPGNLPHVAFHHWAAGAALATSIAHKGGLAEAKALAAAVIDLLRDSELVADARKTFEQELE